MAVLLPWLAAVGLAVPAPEPAAGSPGLQSASVVVVAVPRRSAVDRAGLRAGDVLEQWSREDGTPRPFDSPFEATRVEHEELALGALTVTGERDEKARIWTLQPGWRGFTTRPRFAARAEQLYLEGETKAAAGDVAGATAAWESAAREDGDPQRRAWLKVAAGRAAARAQLWKQMDAAFDAAVGQLEAHAPMAAAQILREWAMSLMRRGRLEQAVACHERGLVLEGPRGESLSLAAHWAGLAWLRRALGRAELANELGQQALAMRERLAPEGLDVASSLSDLGSFALDTSDPELAARRHRRALKIRRRLDPDGTEVARSLNNLGIVLVRLGQLRQAEELFRESLALKEKLEQGPESLSNTLNNLGIIAEKRGDLGAAEGYYTRAVSIAEKAGLSLLAAGVLTNRGLVASLRGDHAAAVDHQRRARALQDKTAPESPLAAMVLHNLGIALRGAGELAEAREYQERAAALQRRLTPKGLDLAEVLTDLAALDTDAGDLSRAGQELAEAQGLLERLAPRSSDLASALNHVGELALRRGDTAAAQGAFGRALDLWRSLGPGSQGEPQSLHGLARVAQATDRPEEAGRLHCDAVDALDQQRARLSQSDERRLGFGVLFAQQYRDCLDAHVTAGRAAEAFHVLERGRARSLLALLAERDLALDLAAPQPLLQEIRALEAEYDRVLERAAQLDPEQQEEHAALRARQRELRGRLATMAAELRQVAPGLGAVAYPQPLGYEAARRVLDPGTLLLSYDVGPERVRLFALTAEGDVRGARAQPETFSLAIGEPALRKKVAAYLRVLRRPEGPAPVAQARELFALLLGPAEAQMRRARRILVAPDGPLHLLPFASLVLPGSTEKPRFLVEWRPVHVATSATLYAELLRSRPAAGRRRDSLVAFGDPLLAGWKGGPRETALGPRLRSALHDGLPELPSARQEVQDLARLFPGARVYVGGEATEGRVKQLGPDVGYLHFACHALLDEHEPLNSALVLSRPPAGDTGENGLLQAWEVFESVRLQAELVTLAACDTGLGEEIGGEGLASLTRAFTYAGARSVLASLWPVGDASTDALMRRFYRELRAGQPKDEALRRAQRALIRSGLHASPFHWAAFQLNGDWR